MTPIRAATLLTLALWASPALAHHSFAMFDQDKTLTLEGTVKEFQWTNPHTWLQLLVKDPVTGKEQEWGLEAQSVAIQTRMGWTRHSLQPGDHVVVQIHPVHGGLAGGSLLSATVNGKPVGNPPAP